MSKKYLVAYFSASGVTRTTAKELAKALGGDVYEIEAKDPYTSEDLNWMDKKSRSSVEMSNQEIRPEMKENKLDVVTYDEVLIGFPVWWGIAPTIINTFIEKYDLTSKTVRAFATSGGSGIEKCEKNLKRQYPSINWKDGKLINTSSQIKQFVDQIH